MKLNRLETAALSFGVLSEGRKRKNLTKMNYLVILLTFVTVYTTHNSSQASHPQFRLHIFPPILTFFLIFFKIYLC